MYGNTAEMPVSHIWLLSGYAGSGKDTTANILANLLGDLATWDSFAGAVKDDVATMYEFSREYLDTQEGKSRRLQFPDGSWKTVRDLLIEHAEGQKQLTHPGIWAERLKTPTTPHWILSDWRFVDELTTIRMRFPHAAIHTVRITRPGIVPSHSYTEHELDAFAYEYTIDNAGSLLYIANQVKSILERIQ
jgi:hypothetical protein